MRRTGRPSRQQLYNDAFYQCISRRTLPADLHTASVIEGLDDPSVEAGGHDDLGLLDEAFGDPVPSDEPEPVEAELAESEPAGQVEEPVEAEPAERVEVPVEPEPAERVEDPPVLGRRADLSMLERLIALRLIYGRGPA